MNWQVYIILCSDGSLYTGITTDMERRLAQHAAGVGAKYFRSRRPQRVVYLESGHDRSTASSRELEIKGLKRADKAGQLNGPGVKAALETLKDFDLGGLTNAVTYTADDHRAMTKTPIFQIQKGKLVKIAEYDMPRKPEWLGL